MTRVAFVVPITDPGRFGYHHTFFECIESLLLCADVYLVCSDPIWPGTHYTDERRNRLWAGCRFISNKHTWYKDDRYTADHYLANMHLGTEQARIDGYDIAIHGSCNWYVPRAAAWELHEWWNYLVEEKVETDSIYVRYQLGDRLMGASAKHESVINLKLKSTWQFTTTEGVVNHLGREIKSERSDFSKFNRAAIVDCAFECTLKEFTEKMNYVRCYQDLIPSRDPVFDWKKWKSYYVNKVKAMPRSQDRLDETGQAIAAKGRYDFLSRLIAREL